MESLRPKILNQIFTASFEKLIDFKSLKMYLLDLGTYLVLIDLPTYLRSIPYWSGGNSVTAKNTNPKFEN